MKLAVRYKNIVRNLPRGRASLLPIVRETRKQQSRTGNGERRYGPREATVAQQRLSYR
jgi:hypothetical protein